eukprot:jgi/Tetstr1/459157/TSEL_004603.t1
MSLPAPAACRSALARDAASAAGELPGRRRGRAGAQLGILVVGLGIAAFTSGAYLRSAKVGGCVLGQVAAGAALANGLGGGVLRLHDEKIRESQQMQPQAAAEAAIHISNDLAVGDVGLSSGSRTGRGRHLSAFRSRGNSAILSRLYRFDPGPAGELPAQLEPRQVPCKTASDCPSGLHQCLNTTCTCPPILRGSADCTAQTPISPMRAYCFSGIMDHGKKLIPDRGANSSLSFLLPSMMGEDGMRDLQRRADWSRCAVVGSSGVLSKSRLGAEIDAHTAVIRFNNAPAQKYAVDVGAKTTLRVQNQDYCGHAESDREMCINYTLRRQCTSTSKQEAQCKGDNLLTVSRPFVNLVHEYWMLNQPRNGKSRMLDVSCRWVCPGNPPVMRASRSKMSINKFMPELVDVPEAVRKCSRRCDKKTSAGFFGILFAAHICGEVNVYGFPRAAANLRYYFPKARSSKMTTTNPPEARHHWRFEKLCLNYLRDAGIPGLQIRN